MNQNLNDFMSGGFEKDALKEIKQMLDEELAKPAQRRDYDKIDELTDAYSYLTGMETFIQEATERGVQKVARSAEGKPNIHMNKRIRLFTTVGIAAVMLFAANVFTVVAYQQDIFTVIIHYTQNGFSVEYPPMDTIELPTTTDDPYGIKTECAKYGLDVLTPTYLPEGAKLGNYEYNKADGYCTSVNFWYYYDNKAVINLCYNLYENPSGQTLIPSDDFNLSEIEINGISAIVSKEDNQYSVIFRDGNLETIISSDYGYEECDKIAASLQ